METDRLAQERAKYEAHHTTTGCKITHMIGVPMIALSVPVFFFSRKGAAALFGAGWVLQFSGHLIFEKNSPVFLEDPLNPYTYAAALLFVRDEWLNVCLNVHDNIMGRGKNSDDDLFEGG